MTVYGSRTKIDSPSSYPSDAMLELPKPTLTDVSTPMEYTPETEK